MKYINVSLLISVILLWSYGWVLTKIGLNYIGPFSFAALRFVLASIVMIGILMFIKHAAPKGKEWLYLIIIGLLQTSAMFLLINYGMMFVSVGKASILIYSMPIWSSVFAYFFLKELMNKRKILSLILGSVGLLIIIGLDFFYQQNGQMIFGEILLLLAAISWAASNIMVKKYFRNHNKLVVSTWQMIFGTIGVVIVALFTEWGQPIQWTATSIFVLVFTGIVASAFCFTCWYLILSRMDTTAASISLLFIPIISIFLEWLILGETVGFEVVIGTIFITCGVYFATVNMEKKDLSKKIVDGSNRRLENDIALQNDN